MNKRQKKKSESKCVYPLIDEYNLLTMNPEERKRAIADYESYCQKHCLFKHYKDKYRIRKPFFYAFPIGEEYHKMMSIMFHRVRRPAVAPCIVVQDMEQLQRLFPGENPEYVHALNDYDNVKHAVFVI